MTQSEKEIIALYEDARSMANIALWSVKLQVKRLKTHEITEPFVMQQVADFHFLITALQRLRNIAKLVSGLANISCEIKKAIEKFDKILPDLNNIRNVLEHIDEYRLGKGRNTEVKIKGLQTIILGETIEWLGYRVNIKKTLEASEYLFQAIKNNPPNAYIKKVEKYKTNNTHD